MDVFPNSWEYICDGIKTRNTTGQPVRLPIAPIYALPEYQFRLENNQRVPQKWHSRLDNIYFHADTPQTKRQIVSLLFVGLNIKIQMSLSIMEA